MQIDWNDVRLFLAVAELGSLTHAARQLGIAQPTVSRRLAELEDQLGYALFHRSVGGTALTNRGERWLEPARQMAEAAGALEHASAQGNASPSGIVRITAPPGVADDFVAPLAARLRARHKDIQLHVLARTEYLDLGRREADLALRTRPPTQRDLVRVATLEHDNDAFATPSYIATLPKKRVLADIGFIGWAPPFEQLPPNAELAALIPGFAPVFASDDFIVQRSAAEAGVGAMFLAKLTHRFSRRSSLVALGLELGEHGRGALHLVAHKSALVVPRVRAVAELVTEEFHWAARKSVGVVCC